MTALILPLSLNSLPSLTVINSSRISFLISTFLQGIRRMALLSIPGVYPIPPAFSACSDQCQSDSVNRFVVCRLLNGKCNLHFRHSFPSFLIAICNFYSMLTIHHLYFVVKRYVILKIIFNLHIAILFLIWYTLTIPIKELPI